MRLAIYSRKSRFTGKGESTQNQIQICKEYAENFFDIDAYMIYEDEGFSGGNTNRPQFQKMLKDAKSKKFEILICYRLDRISRNISDFSNLIKILNDKNIGFISVRESFDTTTPMGRAMLYIASVFAQLERETIAERIQDNMHRLARTGRWLGGNKPTGYDSEPILYIDNNMKEKKMYKLIPVKKELDIVALLYKKYLALKSLQKVETYCLQNHIKTKNDYDFHKNTIKNILTNPVYAKADLSMYEYFKSSQADICVEKEKFNGKFGILAYNKRLLKNNRLIKYNELCQWIVSIGKHKGIIEGSDWVKVQQLLEKHKNIFPRQGTSHAALLSGLLYCKKCGSFMRVTYGAKIKGTNNHYSYYECNLRFNSKRKRCNNKRLSALIVDNLVIEKIKDTITCSFFEEIDQAKEFLKMRNLQNKKIEKQILENQRSIEHLVKKISKSTSELSEYLLSEINVLHVENKKLKNSINSSNSTIKIFHDNFLKKSIIDFNKKFHTASFEEKRNLLGSIIKRIDWDGENLDIRICE